jgi:hypothetical protein
MIDPKLQAQKAVEALRLAQYRDSLSPDEQESAIWAVAVMERLSLDALQRLNAATRDCGRGNAAWLAAFAEWRKAAS